MTFLANCLPSNKAVTFLENFKTSDYLSNIFKLKPTLGLKKTLQSLPIFAVDFFIYM